MCLLLASFYALINTFKRSGTINSDTGALRVSLSALGMMVGGCLAALGFYAS
jgi:hypothetical protein